MQALSKKLLAISLAASLIVSCTPNVNETAQALYNDGQDALALKAATDDLDGKDDLFGRLFIVQYHLARYLETGDQPHVEQVEANYQGVSSLKRLPKSNPLFEELIWMARYYDAAIQLFVKQDQPAALALLNTYCPQSAHLDKIRCHFRNYDYFERQAWNGYDRYKQETAFLANLTVGDAYQDYKMIGHALELLASYDIDHAAKRIQPYLSRSADHDEVLKRYCREVGKQVRYGSDMPKYAAYKAAYAQAGCAVYSESQKRPGASPG